MTIILFLIILAILIFVHELGHFSFAKLFNIRVDEFSIGFPPRIFQKKKGETLYSVGAIPFGGYVKIFGENYDEVNADGVDKRSFTKTTALRQILILSAGVLFNFIFAWILIVFSLNIGAKTPIASELGYLVSSPQTTITYIKDDSPAEKAGIMLGDEIVFASSSVLNITSPKPADLQLFISSSVGEIELDIKRGDSVEKIFIVPESGVVEGKKAIGVYMDYVGEIKVGFFKSISLGLKITSLETVSIAKGLGNFIKAIFVQDKAMLSDVSGPIGIAEMTGQASAFGFSYLLGFIALISINLAILNLVPFPALDGGRIIFVIIEKIFGKKIKPIIFSIVNLIGFGLLMLLMAFVTYKDIVRIIN